MVAAGPLVSGASWCASAPAAVSAACACSPHRALSALPAAPHSQAEYAMEAVKQGSACVGARSDTHVVRVHASVSSRSALRRAAARLTRLAFSLLCAGAGRAEALARRAGVVPAKSVSHRRPHWRGAVGADVGWVRARAPFGSHAWGPPPPRTVPRYQRRRLITYPSQAIPVPVHARRGAEPQVRVWLAAAGDAARQRRR